MIDPLIFFLALLFSIATANIFVYRYRPAYVSVLGAFFLGALAPGSAVFLFFVILQSLFVSYLVSDLKRDNPWRKYAPYLLLINLFWVDFHSLLLGHYVHTLGVSFSIIRIFMTAKNLVSSRKNLKTEYVEWIFVSAFYLPAIMVGPIFSGMDIRKQVRIPEKDLGTASFLYRNAFWGLTLAVLVSTLFSNIADSLDSAVYYHLPLLALMLFMQLFTAFWGQSLMAEMGSRLINISIPANFDKPWLATDIKNFWQRWHISMAQFVMQFIFLPLTINNINPRIATVIAFVFMGLWHEVALGYIVWGFCHGLLMAFWPSRPEAPSVFRNGIERIITIISVIVLSYVANYLFA